MSGRLCIRNAQRAMALDTRLLRSVLLALLGELLREEGFDLGISLVRTPEMRRLNETFLRHAGSTDVLTFDYSERPRRLPTRQLRTGFGGLKTQNSKLEPRNPKSRTRLHGEIFICVDEAVRQARRFGVAWQGELVRYAVHGLLHLCGYDDLQPARRREMKREENRLLRRLGRRFALAALGAPRRAWP